MASASTPTPIGSGTSDDSASAAGDQAGAPGAAAGPALAQAAQAETSAPASAPGSPAAAEQAAQPSAVPAGAGSSELLASIKSDTSSILESLQAMQSNLGGSLSSASGEMADNQMIAQNQPPAEPIVVNSGGGGGSSAPPSPPQPLPKAKTRAEDNSFMRALARDFSHPTAFTSVSLT